MDRARAVRRQRARQELDWLVQEVDSLQDEMILSGGSADPDKLATHFRDFLHIFRSMDRSF
jgi:hypothetical protein